MTCFQWCVFVTHSNELGMDVYAIHKSYPGVMTTRDRKYVKRFTTSASAQNFLETRLDRHARRSYFVDTIDRLPKASELPPPPVPSDLIQESFA